MWTDEVLAKAMERAIEIADSNKTPFAALLLDPDGHIALEAVNTSKTDGPLAHAEMNLLNHAIEMNLPVESMCLVSTCEPCPMCMGAIIWSKVRNCAFSVSIEEASKYLRQIHVSAEEIADAAFTNVQITKGIHSDKALKLFKKRG